MLALQALYTTYGNSVCLSVPLKSWLQVTYPLLKAASFDTFCLVAPQPQKLEKEV